MTETAVLAGERGGGERCIRCGYHLAGLPADALCPECGLAADRSRERTLLLRSADLRWLGLARRGLRDFELAMGVLFGAMLLLLLLLVAHLLALNMWGVRAPKIVENIVDAGMVLILLGAAAVHMRGCMLSTLASHSDYAAPGWVRAVVRLCGVVLPLSIGGVFVLRHELVLYSGPARLAIRAAIELNAVAFFFGLAALLRHYERLTAAWNVERRKRHAQVRMNLGLLIVVLLVNAWVFQIPILGAAVAGVPVLLLGIAYLAFHGAVGRVREAVVMEQVIGEETGALGGSAGA